MGAKVGGGKQGMDEINVTPLIDIVLVLLIIFMVMTPVTIQQMASNLPPNDVEDPPPPPPDKPPDQLMVAVYADGSTALNLEPYATEADPTLKDQLTRRLLAREKKTVFVDAHPDANYGRVVHVLDLVREAGAEKIGFAELKDEGPARLTPGQAAPNAGGGVAEGGTPSAP